MGSYRYPSYSEAKCIGSPQHLKNKFGSAYRVTIRAKSSAAAIESFMHGNGLFDCFQIAYLGANLYSLA